jgi:hypothetical protein
MELKSKAPRSYPTRVGVQPTMSKSPISPTRSHQPRVSTRELDQYLYLRQKRGEKATEVSDDTENVIQPIASADVTPTTFVTTDMVPQSTESYGPGDPRANPAGSLVSMSSGFLPPPK